jgi:hypothetical protein
MNIKECVDFINFWIRKERGAFYTIEESIELIDRGQVAYYNDLIPKYATSQIIKDSLSSFRAKYSFSTNDLRDGLLTIPNYTFRTGIKGLTPLSLGFNKSITSAMSAGDRITVESINNNTTDFINSVINSREIDFPIFIFPTINITPNYELGNVFINKLNDDGETNYLDLLDVSIQVNGGYYAVKMVNEDELSNRLNSQIDPVTYTAPVGEMVQLRKIQLFPKTNNYTGSVSYMRKPLKPIYGYTVTGGRTIVYDPATSTQLEWRESDINMVLLKALSSIGINLSDAEVSQFAEVKSQQNYQGVNHL